MALTSESQKILDDTVASLSSIGQLISNKENMTESEAKSMDWSFQTMHEIGGFTCGENVNGEEVCIYSNPYAKNHDSKVLVRYRAKTRTEQKYIICNKWGTLEVHNQSTGLVSSYYYIDIDGHKYKWNGTSQIGFEGYIDGVYIKHNFEKGNAFFSKFTKEIKKGEKDSYNLTIPFYSWYKNGNTLWIGTVLSLNGPNNTVKECKGWIRVFTDITDVGSMLHTLYIKKSEDDNIKTIDNPTSQIDFNEANGIGVNIETEKKTYVDWNGNPEWENSQGGYNEALLAADSAAQFDYWSQLYGKDMGTYSLKSHRSIIGLPLQFMSNVDMRVGSSTYGKQFMEDILYDMSIACIKPGGPVLNPNLAGDDGNEITHDVVESTLRTVGKWKAYLDAVQEHGVGNTFKQYLFTLFKGGGARFYSFQSDYTHYTHYVNTLCHMFIGYLNIGDKEYDTPNGKKKYAFYNDEAAEIETDGGLGLHTQFGWDKAVYVYYSPESQLSHTFSNSTQASSLNNTLAEASNAVKEWGFFINAAGFETGKEVASFTQELATNSMRDGILSRLFGNATEGVTTVLAGNNLSLPEIYSDSETTVQHTFKIKLASPYGDPESVFLYVLRPLARLLAFSLPRQYGPNSYQSPFIVQAFSKGQFNCQLGIVTNLSITRCGNGGESHTIHHIPTELEVTLEIADMYEKVFLSNEYFGNSTLKVLVGAGIDLLTGGPTNVGEGIGTNLTQFGSTLTATRLIFNNVGLIDFVASFCGANLNQPSGMTSWTFILNMMKNRATEKITYSENDGWKFPQWEKSLNDAYSDAVTKLYSGVTTIA